MAGATDEILAALAASDLADDVQEVILTLLHDVPAGDPLAGSDQGPIRLTSIEVEGVRGIGPRSTLELDPGVGLTLVVGPNGCGKSSFAEAAERVITGTTLRWEGSATDAREDWRNVHHGWS